MANISYEYKLKQLINKCIKSFGLTTECILLELAGLFFVRHRLRNGGQVVMG